MDEKLLDRITDFIMEHMKYADRNVLRDYIKEHFKYGTIDYVIDEHGEIVAVCRWNIKEDGKVGEVLDLSVRKDCRGHNLGRQFMLRAIQKHPKVEHLEYQRGSHGDGKTRRLPVKRVLESKFY